MARRYVVAGTAGQSVDVFLQDRSSGDGVITMTTDKVRAAYRIGTTGAVTTFALVGRNTTAAWASGGWAECSSVNMPGVYTLDVPDASIASTPNVSYFIHCSTPGSNFLPVALDLQVVSSGGSDMPSNVILYKGQSQTSVDIGAMLSSVNSKVTSVDSRLTSMDTMLSSVNSHVTSADTVVNSVLTKVTSIDSRLTSMDTMLSSVNAKVTSIDTDIDTVITKVTSIDSRLTSMDTMLSSVNSHVTSADTVVNSVLTKVTSIDSRLTSMDTMLSSVNSKVTSVDTVVAAIKVETTAIKAKTDSLTFTQAGKVDSNIHYVNNVQVQGVGTTVDTWRPV